MAGIDHLALKIAHEIYGPDIAQSIQLSPSFIILGHELIHCLHNQWGLNLREIQKGVFDASLSNSFSSLEEFETIQGLHFSFCENELRVSAGFDKRYGVRRGHRHITEIH